MSKTIQATNAVRGILTGLISGQLVSQAVCTVAQLGVADCLRDGAKSSAELASTLGLSERHLYRLLRVLCCWGIFSEDRDHRFALTSVGHYLRSDVAFSVRDYARYFGHPTIRESWTHLWYSIEKGQPSFEKVTGKPFFAYAQEHPQFAALANDVMASADEPRAIMNAYRFDDVGTIVDVGGGRGVLLTTILEENPASRGILVELPHVAEEARSYLLTRQVGDRCNVRSADIFVQVPRGGDVYILKHVLHDWDDAKAALIMRNCRQALRTGGKLLVIEHVVGAAGTARSASLADLAMLVQTNGQERTASEFQHLYESSGFELRRIVPTATTISVIEGVAI